MSLNNDEKPRKNPFAPRKATTVRRGKDEVYPYRKGLNRPEFLGNSPLDVLFQELETVLSDSIETATVETLGIKLFRDETKALSYTDLRHKVVDKLLLYLILVQEYSIQAHAKSQQKDLITISLHDIKTFGKLINLIILLGIYPAITAFGIGVPIEKRRLKDFGRLLYKALKIETMQPVKNTSLAVEKYAPHSRLLSLLYEQLLRVFSTDSDARNLLLKGSGYADFLVVTITLITVPHFEKSVGLNVAEKYDQIARFATTFELYQDYSLLLSSPSPPYFKTFVMEKLQLLPSCAPKKDGVLTLIEFVLGLRDTGEVNVEKLDHVTNVLLLKPKSLSSLAYFTAIGSQCYELLVNINRLTIVTCVCHFIEKLWTKNHRIVHDFFLEKVWLNFNPLHDTEKVVLVSESALNNNVNVLLSLTNRALPTDLLMAVFAPILVHFWTYYCFLRVSKNPVEVAQNILVSFFTQISIDEEIARTQLARICENLVTEHEHEWQFRIGSNKLVEISSRDLTTFEKKDPEQKVLLFMRSLDANCDAFLALLEQVDDLLIKGVFLSMLSNWVEGKKDSDKLLDENPFLKLADLRLLEEMGNKLKDRLAQTPYDILLLVQKILGHPPKSVPEKNMVVISVNVSENGDSEADSDDEDEEDGTQTVSHEVLTVVLELLSAILSETQPAALNEKCRIVLSQIRGTLSENHTHLKAGQGLATRIGFVLQEEKAPSTDLELEKRAFARAIANLNDPLVPIRAHGLYLLRQLVEQRSAVISVDFAVNLHLVQLRDPDPFVYLNAIKGLDSLLALDDAQVLHILTSIYRGPVRAPKGLKEETHSDNRVVSETETEPESDPDLDERLRVGEVLLRYIQAQDEAFSGETARLVCDSALALVRRPADDSNKPDDRLRMSAMSIMGTCCNTNILGIVQNIGNAIDCAVGILELETTKDLAIMRRSAIVLIHDLVSGTSKSEKVLFPREYMQKVLLVLKYVQSHDLDLLAREQAASVVAFIDELVEAALTFE